MSNGCLFLLLRNDFAFSGKPLLQHLLWVPFQCFVSLLREKSNYGLLLELRRHPEEGSENFVAVSRWTISPTQKYRHAIH